MKSDLSVDVKKKLESGSCIIVFDTNVFLNLYRVSPDYADFLLKCLDIVKSYIIVPKTVQIEFNKYSKAMYYKRQNSIENLIKESVKLVKRQKDKMLNSCFVMQKRKFPEIEELIRCISEKYESAEKLMRDYFEDHNDLTQICDTWTSDKPSEFIILLDSNKQVLCSLDYLTLYAICEEGEARYKKQIPPGYKDAKEKDGVRKFCDLIWWKEILKFAQEHKKDVILVTDDIKEDWWKKDERDFVFREELLEEFDKETKYLDNGDPIKAEKHLNLVPFISEDFFKALSTSYDVEQPETIDYALTITSDAYISLIEDRVFDTIIDILAYSNDSFLKEETMTRFGSEGVEEWEIEDHEFVDYELIGRDGDKFYYNIKYKVIMSGDSYDYWGRDDDTKDVILSNAFHHTVEGVITVKVTRTVDLTMDFNDIEFDDCKIVEGEFEEMDYSEDGEEDFDDGYGQGVCPKCGKPLSFETDALNGFCIKCTKESDDI